MINFMYVALKNKIESDIKRRVDTDVLDEAMYVICYSTQNGIISKKQGDELVDLIIKYCDERIEEELSKTDKYLIFIGKIN